MLYTYINRFIALNHLIRIAEMNPCTVKNIFKTYIQFSNQLVALSFATFIIYHIFLKFQVDFLKNLKNNILRKTYNQQGVKERETPYG